MADKNLRHEGVRWFTAVLPKEELSVGTSRQPRRLAPSAEMMAASASLTEARSAGFVGKNNMPTPYSPGAGSLKTEPGRFR